MNKLIILWALIAIFFAGCKNDQNHEDKHGHSHKHEAHLALEPIAHTIYTDKTELFVEFKPLVVGQKTKFAAHFTQLGENFTAVTEGSVTVSLIGKEKQPTNNADGPSSPGIFRLAIKPENAGVYTLLFDIQTKEFSDKITIDSVFVFPDTKSALGYSQEDTIGEEINYLKEQAWNIEFATKEVKKQSFTEIIKATGQILPAQGDEFVLSSKNNGVITFGNKTKMIGSEVNPSEILFKVSGKDLIDDNLNTKYTIAKSNYEKSKIDFEKGKELVKALIISQKDFRQRQLEYENAETTFNNISNRYTAGGQKIKSPIRGYIKNIMVHEGQYVKIGQPVAIISQNRKLILKAEVSQKYFSKLNSISSANFKMAYDDKIYSTERLNGKLISYGKHTSDNAYYIPVNFEIDNKGGIIPGAYIEAYLKSNIIQNALVIPFSALMEEQGNYFAYVQTSGEGFQKRELKLGVNDGIYIQILSGIKENERVVTKGAYQIKLATMSGKMPAHGHEH